MLDVCVANPFISFDMFEKNSLVAPVPTDVIDCFLISEVGIGFVDDVEPSLEPSSKLCCC